MKKTIKKKNKAIKKLKRKKAKILKKHKKRLSKPKVRKKRTKKPKIWTKNVNRMKKRIERSFNKLKKDIKRKASFEEIEKDNNALLMLLGECNYIVREFHEKILKSEKKRKK
jgi:hypothetical protein